MGYVFDFNTAADYEKWYSKPNNLFAADLQHQLMIDLLAVDAGAVLLEGDPDAALSLYESQAGDGRGLLVTTKNPLRLRRIVDAEVPILWVGGPGEGSGEDGPVAIDLEAGKVAADLMRERTRPVLYLADLEQLRLHAPFPRVVEFVKGLIDNASLRDGVLLASVAPKAVAPTELASLRRRFDRVRAL